MVPAAGTTRETEDVETPVRLDGRIVYEGSVLTMRVDEVRLPNGAIALREVVDHRGAVVVAALDADDRLVLVKQYRYAIDRDLLEFTAGVLELGEDPAKAAVRELREEAGLTAGTWDRLGSFFSSPGFVHEELHAYLARHLQTVPRELDFDEDIDLEWIPLQTLLDRPEQIMDAKTLATLLLVERFLEREKGAEGDSGSRDR
jgi:8-oxo-dGTP pyrophosphatase MutT (NUDIX family)